jgi:type III secretion system-like peptide-binding chaperone
MLRATLTTIACVTTLVALSGSPGSGEVASSPPIQSDVEAVLANILTLNRPGQDGLATVWDGNKYVQCRRMPDQILHCEAAGALMQPSLARTLSPERIARLAVLGWHVDPSFGNYVQSFPAGLPVKEIAERILQALKEGYDVDLDELDTRSDWITSQPCPPRNGPSQNLAGMINDHPAMAATAARGCAYSPGSGDEPSPLVRTSADLINVYGTRVTGEIQRLRVNSDRRIYIVLGTGAGYVQCAPVPSPRGVYCEAQSAESWPVLGRILTAERLARLRASGYADPGRSPNYWKVYAATAFSDAAIAAELLTILHDVYGYDGSPKLEFKTEKGPS